MEVQCASARERSKQAEKENRAMGKTIAEIYEEVLKNAELQKEFMEAVREGNVEGFAKAHDCDAASEQITSFLNTKLKEDKELSPDDLEQIAGGSGKGNGPECTICGSTDTQAGNLAKFENGVMHLQCYCWSCNQYFWTPPL